MMKFAFALICSLTFLACGNVPQADAHHRGVVAVGTNVRVFHGGGYQRAVFLGVHSRDFVRVRVGFNTLVLPTNRLFLEAGQYVDPCVGTGQLSFPAFSYSAVPLYSSSTTIVEGRRRVFIFQH